jgi:hypothetical protein
MVSKIPWPMGLQPQEKCDLHIASLGKSQYHIQSMIFLLNAYLLCAIPSFLLLPSLPPSLLPSFLLPSLSSSLPPSFLPSFFPSEFWRYFI